MNESELRTPKPDIKGELSIKTQQIIGDYYRINGSQKYSSMNPTTKIPLEQLTGKFPDDVSTLAYKGLYFDTNGFVISCRSIDIKVPSDPRYDQQLFKFVLDDQGRTTSIEFSTGVNPGVARAAFDRLAQAPFLKSVQQVFNIESASQADQDLYEHTISDSKIIAEETEEIRKKSHGEKLRKVLNIVDDKDVIQLLQGEYAVTSPQKRYLETTGVATCIAVSIFNPVLKKASLTHMDALTDVVGTMRLMRGMTQDMVNQGLEIRVLGGTTGSMDLLLGVKREISSWGEGAKIVEWDVLNSVKNIVLDGQTGEIFDVTNQKLRMDDQDYKLRSLARQSKTMMSKLPADQIRE